MAGVVGAGCREESPPQISTTGRAYTDPISGEHWDYDLRTETRHVGGSRTRAVLIKFSVVNRTSSSVTFATAGRPLRNRSSPPVEAGLTEPRPVYDLLFVGTVGRSLIEEELTPYVWVWSSEQSVAPPSSLTLAPNETRVLLDVRWRPPDFPVVRGGFTVRFADWEWSPGIGIGERYDILDRPHFP
jgi:hypothetical protein